tara:strand:+ start:459 stop:563 length:105 start_codon:yes stop_codon:yes gene_type:complete
LEFVEPGAAQGAEEGGAALENGRTVVQELALKSL